MVLESRDKKYVLKSNDRIMFNGQFYILITQPQFCNGFSYGPVLKTNTVRKLINQGTFILADEKFNGEFDMYKIKENENVET